MNLDVSELGEAHGAPVAPHLLEPLIQLPAKEIVSVLQADIASR
jgi:hypothetical protein